MGMIPIFDSLLLGLANHSKSCVVDQDIDTDSLSYLFHGRHDGLGIGNVESPGPMSTSRQAVRQIESVGDVGERKTRALCSKSLSHGSANAAGGTSQEDLSSCKGSHARLDVEIRRQDDHVPNGHMARAGQHEQNGISDFTRLDQAAAFFGLLEVLLGPIGKERADHRPR